MSPYKAKKILVIGLGMSGKAAARLLLLHGAYVDGIDRNENLIQQDPSIGHLIEKGLVVYQTSALSFPLQYDLIVVSPGVPSEHFVWKEAEKAGISVIGEIELGCRLVKNQILGITGTNGKTTVTLLVTHVLNQSGLKAVALGNVGTSFCDEILHLDPQTIVVLELSSFQLETLSQKALDGGIILNITPDHLDRYLGMDDYAQAKIRLGSCLKKNASLYVEEQVLQKYYQNTSFPSLCSYGYAKCNTVYTDLIHVYYKGVKAFDVPQELKNKKSHELENLMAAFSLCKAFDQITAARFMSAWQSFKKPAHRIEFVSEQKGVHFYDDSKGTNIDAVVRAVEYLDGPIILIAGGVDKGAPYVPWLEVFRNKVKCVCAIGQAAAKIQAQLSHQLPVTIFQNLEQAVEAAVAVAERGDNVLLSPGCASFDMFKDYAHRGEVFQKIVRELNNKG